MNPLAYEKFIVALDFIIKFYPEAFGTLWRILIFWAGPLPGLSDDTSLAISLSTLASASSSELISFVLLSDIFFLWDTCWRSWACPDEGPMGASSALDLLFGLLLPKL